MVELMARRRRPWLAIAVAAVSSAILGIGIAGAVGAPSGGEEPPGPESGPPRMIVIETPAIEQPSGNSQASGINMLVYNAVGELTTVASCVLATADYALDAGTLADDGKMTVGLVTDSTWTGCSGPMGVPVVVAHLGRWPVIAEGGLAGAQGLLGLRAIILKVKADRNCTFTVTGSSTAELRLLDKEVAPVAADSALQVTEALGCSGFVNNGDSVVIDGSFQLS